MENEKKKKPEKDVKPPKSADPISDFFKFVNECDSVSVILVRKDGSEIEINYRPRGGDGYPF